MAKIQLVEFLAWDDPSELCRDERCPIEEVHRIHTHRRVATEPRVQVRKQRPTLDDCVNRQVMDRCVRTFRDIYNGVIHDYGSITERGVYRAIERLIDARRVIRVVPWPNGRQYRLGGYLRYDSPLIWVQGGHSSIQEQLQDCGFSESTQGKARAARCALQKSSFVLSAP